MRILLISQYFFPETGATSNRIYSLAKYFKEKGHEVRVIAEKPNHPGGIFLEGYKGGLFIDKEYKGVPVTYTWVHTKPEKNFLDRILFYISFMFMAIFVSFRLKKNYDIVLASSPPLFVGISGWILAKIKGARFIFDVRDLWPDVAVKMGELNNKNVIRIAELIEKFLYGRADLIIAVTHSFKKSIGLKGVPKEKIKIVTNGTDPVIFSINKSKIQLRQSLNLRKDHFIVSYIGNLGLAQGLIHILKSAKEIKNKKIANITFLMVGDGPKKKELKSIAYAENLTNMVFVDRVSLPKAAEYMNASDVLLVPLANDPIYSQFIPSKLFDSMAASKPVLLSVDGEAYEILKKSQSGLFYEAENSDALTKNILWLNSHKNKAKEMGIRGRAFVTEHYTRDAQAKQMLKYFKE